MLLTLMAKRSPVARFLHKYTRPKAPRLIGFRISKSSMVMVLMLLPLVLTAGVPEPAHTDEHMHCADSATACMQHSGFHAAGA